MAYLRMDMNEDPFTCKNRLVNVHIELNEPKKSKFLKHVQSYLTTNFKCKLDVTNTIQVPFRREERERERGRRLEDSRNK